MRASSGSPVPLTTQKPKGNLTLAVVALIVGGVLQGLLSNASRVASADVSWGGWGALLGMVLFGWFARRLRWWLILLIPASLFFMAPISLMTQANTMRPVSTIYRQLTMNPDCAGWEHLDAQLDPIGVKIRAFADDVNETTVPDVDDFRRWANAADGIRSSFHLLNELEHPPVLDEYLATSMQWMTNYRDGFRLIVDGKYDEGQALLDEGDTSLRTRAQAQFRVANETCAGP